MKKRSSFLLLVLSLGLALSLARAAAAAAPEVPPISAALSLTALDGRKVDFGELRGEVVLLDFWATWCKPCREATPYLERLHRRMEGRPFALIGVSADRDRAALVAYLAEERVPWPQIWDGEHRVGGAFGVSSWPSYLLIDHEGRPVATLNGWSDTHGRLLDREIARHVRRAERAARRAAAEADAAR